MLKTIEIQPKKQYEQSIYNDVVSHCNSPFIERSRYTTVHETSHKISSELRNAQKDDRLNVFYLLNNKAAMLVEPPVKLNDINIPPILRGMRHNLYLRDQKRYWNNEPLYIFEEWNCYTLGGMCAVNDAENRLSLERTDAVAGMFEFIIYATGLAMTIKDKAKTYWDNSKQFRYLFDFMLRRSEKVFHKGRTIPEFKSSSSDELYEKYNSSQEGKKFKEFAESMKWNNVNWTLTNFF
jgi:hypothetical protein